ncbi:MAG: GNAT family N-acetyltransferase [Candidatus Gastranaerophilaceae bacterium]
MCKFKRLVDINSDKYIFTKYILSIVKCYRKYLYYLQDDFLLSNTGTVTNFILNTMPNFWVITDYSDEFMGFVYLDNFIGNGNVLYSAELTTCFDKKAWGSFTKYCAKIFLKKAFDVFGLQKIKAQIYPDNHRIKTLLKSAGFMYESTLKKETLRSGKMQDIEVYAIYRDYYYKTR